MAQRVKDLIKRSGSKIAAPQGSVKHIGTTPYRFRIDIFVSGVERVHNATKVSVACERRGNRHATPLINVVDGKAEIGHTITLECTLFRKTPKNSKNAAAGAPAPPAHDTAELHFDEKLAKIVLRKGAVDGKAMGKISVDFAKYIKGTTSTVFADLTLSNGSIVITKIEATMMHIGKKSKNGSRAGSDTLSEITEVYRDDDSIFGDNVTQDLADLEHITRSPRNLQATFSSDAAMSPTSSITATDSPKRLTSMAKAATFAGTVPSGQQSLTTDSVNSLESSPELLADNACRGKGKEGMKESPSLRERFKTKLTKDRKGTKKSKEDKSEETKARALPSSTTSAATSSKREKEKLIIPPELVSELKELKAQIHTLKKENSKLKTTSKNAQEEINALKADLQARELDLEDEKNKSIRGQNLPRTVAVPELSNTIKEKDRRIAELEAQNESLLEELEENHEQQVESTQLHDVSKNQIRDLKKKIEELEIALKREPRFLDVVNELKVTKVSLALANMEKEQALFQMQAMQHKLGLIA